LQLAASSWQQQQQQLHPAVKHDIVAPYMALMGGFMHRKQHDVAGFGCTLASHHLNYTHWQQQQQQQQSMGQKPEAVTPRAVDMANCKLTLSRFVLSGHASTGRNR
jgi:hypothetical protein